jgi:hypothetical protein
MAKPFTLLSCVLSGSLLKKEVTEAPRAAEAAARANSMNFVSWQGGQPRKLAASCDVNTELAKFLD